jgi:hypothetical protein
MLAALLGSATDEIDTLEIGTGPGATPRLRKGTG